MKFIFGIALACLAAACAAPAPTSPQAAGSAPSYTLLPDQYQYVWCSGWSGNKVPPVTRTVVDIIPTYIDATTRTPAAAGEIEAAGGRIVYGFQGGMYRIEIDVAAVPKLIRLTQPSMFYARTVRDLNDYVVPIYIDMTRRPTASDIVALTSAGGIALQWFDFSTLVFGLVDDSRWNQLKAVSGVSKIDYHVPSGCVSQVVKSS